MKKRRQVLAVTLAATMVMGMGLSTVSAYAKDKGGKTKITFLRTKQYKQASLRTQQGF